MKHKYEKPVRPTVATLTSLLVARETYSDYMPKVMRPSDFEQKANLFASYLLRLWIPIKHNESTNFIPHYQLKSTRKASQLRDVNQHFVMPFQTTSAALMDVQFKQVNAQNLGALIFLNEFMGGDFNSDTLGIVTSSATTTPFFTQKLASFWMDFQNTQIHACSPVVKLNNKLFEMLVKLQKPNLSWWRQTSLQSERFMPDTDELENNNILLVNEIFEVILAIFLTPEKLIKSMIMSILGSDVKVEDFQYYVLDKINRLKKDFILMLSPEQTEVWHKLVKEKGLRLCNNYKTCVSNYLNYNNRTFNQQFSNEINALITRQAIKYKIQDTDYSDSLCDVNNSNTKNTQKSDGNENAPIACIPRRRRMSFFVNEPELLHFGQNCMQKPACNFAQIILDPMN